MKFYYLGEGWVVMKWLVCARVCVFTAVKKSTHLIFEQYQKHGTQWIFNKTFSRLSCILGTAGSLGKRGYGFYYVNDTTCIFQEKAPVSQ